MRIGRKTLRRVIHEELNLSRLTGIPLTPRRLQEAIHQRGIITEDTPEPAREEVGDSLDAQVDRYLQDYEYESKMTKTEGFDWNRHVRRLMLEAPEDEEQSAPEGGDEEGSEEEPAPEDTGPPPEPPKLTIDDIDVESFVNGVVRLIENYDALLEVRSTIARRAINFISKQYDDMVVNTVMEAMRDQHGLVPGKTKDEIESEDFVAPKAGEAGPGGGAV